MAKRGRNQKKDNRNSKPSSRHRYVHPEDMQDEIDAFHKQRDIIPLDLNDDDGESIDDEEEPVFDDEDIDDDDDDEGDDEDDDEDDDDAQDTQFAAKIRKQQKYFKEKFGAIDDEIHDDEEVNDVDKKEVWGVKKPQYYGGHDYEGDSSDDEALKEEEEEILRMQREKSKNLSMEDFGLENFGDDESNRELTMEELSVKGKSKAKDSLLKEVVDNVETFEVRKDLNALSREEQMEVVYSSAPELVGLLSELNDALEELESRVNPLLSMVKMGGIILEGGVRYLEVKQLLLLSYCQAITFYLLLKSEGHPVRDHPVIARLVEIKGLLDKVKQLDGNLPSEIEEFLKKNSEAETEKNKITGSVAPALASESVRKDYSSFLASAEPDAKEPAERCSTHELVKKEASEDHVNKEKKHKRKIDQVGFQSMEMLKARAALEEKLKQDGVFSSFAPKLKKAKKRAKSVDGQFQTYDDFDDDTLDAEKGNHGLRMLSSNKLSQLVSAKPNKSKVISGDDDVPKRDDIGERRRKHELKVLAGAGIKSEDDAVNELGALETDEASDMEEDGDAGVSEDEFYKETKEKRDAKIAAKAKIYKRNPTVPSLPEIVDGKRQITYQIEKNKGLTRPRKKDLKNPRKKYRTKHDKQVK
ncbi:hypothetical protein P3X46_000331 [Hevea brasiliensis]|uniref:Sas10 C-terminal domain-containing protein n=1 Tax=Hevea brasiliensis TaxID=3981 RepID=A0ABQ9N996_HEVBR|nr:protein THALLO [Hevea brasiliensis]KAJ9188987.1 hypothetical protein P3X46_000331 [Hevea brasiliensis]